VKHLLKLASVVYLVRVIRAAAQREHRELADRISNLDAKIASTRKAVGGVHRELSDRIDTIK
jgi:uncharacterized protein YlxW (UPF0749 family)